MLEPFDIEMLKRTIGENIGKLRGVAKWTQAKLAEMTDISEPCASNYLHGERMPPVEYLVGLCSMKEFRDLGLRFTVSDLLDRNFDPESIVRRRNDSSESEQRPVEHADFLGVYLCYFFDQSKSLYKQSHDETRELRYGVTVVYDDYDTPDGKVTTKSMSIFFKAEERAIALAMKKRLDKIFGSKQLAVDKRNYDIAAVFAEYPYAAYSGKATLGNRHTFINIEDKDQGDNALIILYSPDKRGDREYIGGVGAVASVAGGMAHMPTAQKIILSKYELKCPEEEIADYLKMAVADIEPEDEAAEICEFCRKLYTDETIMRYFDEADKQSMVERRLEQLIENYIEKVLYCVGCVTEEEDRAVYKLIERYKPC